MEHDQRSRGHVPNCFCSQCFAERLPAYARRFARPNDMPHSCITDIICCPCNMIANKYIDHIEEKVLAHDIRTRENQQVRQASRTRSLEHQARMEASRRERYSSRYQNETGLLEPLLGDVDIHEDHFPSQEPSMQRMTRSHDSGPR